MESKRRRSRDFSKSSSSERYSKKSDRHKKNKEKRRRHRSRSSSRHFGRDEPCDLGHRSRRSHSDVSSPVPYGPCLPPDYSTQRASSKDMDLPSVEYLSDPDGDAMAEENQVGQARP